MTTLRFACWNLRVGRHPDTVVGEVLQLLDEFDLDVLTVCEAHGYVRSLSHVARGHGYRLIWSRRDGSAMDSAILVRRGLRVRHPRLRRLERVGWERKPGRVGLHWPRSVVIARIEGIEVAAVHQPPGPFGPRFPKRREANEAGYAKMTRLARRWNRRDLPWVAPGDWNRHRTDPVARLFATVSLADLTGSGIDWVASRGVLVRGLHELSPREFHHGSDHNPKVFTVTKEHR